MTDLQRPEEAAAPAEPVTAPSAPASGSSQGSPLASVLRLGALVGLLVLAGLAWGWAVVIVIVALMTMIFLHELGHFVTARWTGMKATEFFLGFGPRLWSFRRGEVEYGVKAVPAGAYVRIIGMSMMDEVAPTDEDRTYRSKSYPARVLVAAAGSIMHFILGLLLLFATFTMFGVPHEDNWVVGNVSPGSPAAEIGLQPDDRIVSVDGAPVSDFASLTTVVRSQPGQQVSLVVERDGEQITMQPTLASANPAGEPVGFLGIGPSYPYVREPVPSAVWESTKEFGNVMVRSVTGLGRLFSPDGLRGYVDNFSAEPSDQNLNNRP
ncbi:MAG TPA: M50 family metallopeptidase, partial [Acidimicrobiales bacterium]